LFHNSLISYEHPFHLDSGTADPEFIQVIGRPPRLDGEDEGNEEGDDDPAPAEANLIQAARQRGIYFYSKY
jgi:hypothetical protein